MKFTSITIAELPDFIQSDTFQKSKVLPITSHRALSQLENPRAQAEDVVLIVAMESDEILGYIGLLPDTLYHKNEAYRVAWLSCWWVQDGTGNLGIQLFLKAYQAWKRRMVITDFTPHIQAIIQKMRLFHFAPTAYGLRGFMRFNTAEVLPPKKPVFQKIRPLLQLGDMAANVLNRGRLQLWKWRQRQANYQLVPIKTIDESTALFIKKHQEQELIKRGATALNWILQQPWVLEDKATLSANIRSEAARYYFSSIAETFQYYPLQVFKDNQLIGFLFLLNRDRHFKLPYVYLEQEHLATVVQALYDFLYQQKAITFTVFHPMMKDYVAREASPFFYKRLIPKDFAIGKGLPKDILNQVSLQDGDGDYVFT